MICGNPSIVQKGPEVSEVVCLFIICSVLFRLGDVLRSNLLLELWTEFNIVLRESTQCIWQSARHSGIFGNLP
jgi:hypothetical protein